MIITVHAVHNAGHLDRPSAEPAPSDGSDYQAISGSGSRVRKGGARRNADRPRAAFHARNGHHASPTTRMAAHPHLVFFLGAGMAASGAPPHYARSYFPDGISRAARRRAQSLGTVERLDHAGQGTD